MDLPRSSTDQRLALACPICNGSGGFGSRTRDGGNPHLDCRHCAGTGWILKRLPELTATECQRLLAKLPAP
jgi:hypothetical protein